MHDTPEPADGEEWVIWNGAHGLVTIVTIGRVEVDSGGRTAGWMNLSTWWAHSASTSSKHTDESPSLPASSCRDRDGKTTNWSCGGSHWDYAVPHRNG